MWRTELRKSDIRVMQVNPSEVMTPFFESNGYGVRPDNPRKLHAEDIAHVIAGMLEKLDDRAFVTSATVWATTPASGSTAFVLAAGCVAADALGHERGPSDNSGTSDSGEADRDQRFVNGYRR